MSLLRKIKTLTITFCLMFLVLEISLRLIGYQSIVNEFYQHGPKYHKVDPELGWSLVSGEYRVPINTLGDTMLLTIKEDTGRVTRSKSVEKGLEKAIFIGGSFTMGRGVNDDQTAVWKAQEHFPKMDFRNLGVGSYGTYQSLIVLEKEIKKENKPKIVIYGLIENHRFRNVAEAQFLENLYYNSYRVHPKMPFVSLDENGGFLRHPPKGMIKLPFSKHSVTIMMLERSVNRINSYNRERDSTELLLLLLLQMKALCEENDITFYTSILNWSSENLNELTSFMKANQIQFIDCNVPLNQANTLRNDGHPDANVHRIWADRIVNRLLQDRVFQ